MTGLQIMVSILAWLSGVIVGFGLINLGLMQGTSQLTPNTDVLRLLSIVETITGVVLVSLILTFLLGTYGVISNLRALSEQFFSAGGGVGEPIASLEPYFPHGKARGLDSHLQSISESFSSYSNGIRLHHAAYYFQSGRDTFSLPYSIRMMGGVIGGLRWGLPGSNAVTQAPALLPLTQQFEQFEDYMHPLLNWTSSAVPETVELKEFRRMIALDAQRHAVQPVRKAPRWHTADDDGLDRWVREFAKVNREMSALVHGEALVNIEEAYQRYMAWLPFAYRAQQFTAAVSRDLDYQPVLTGGTAGDTEAAVPASPPRKHHGSWLAHLSRRMTLIDPGNIRLLGALRALGAATATVCVLGLGFNAFGLPLMPAAVFGGMISMFAGLGSGRSPGKKGPALLAGLVGIVPVSAAIGLNAVIPRGPLASAIALVVLAFVGMGLAQFGPVLRGMGQLAFFTFYFALLLRLRPGEAWLYLAAGLAGVLIAVLIQAIPDRHAHSRLVLDGVNAFEQRVARLFNPLIDAVSAARWDPDLRRRTQAELKQIHHNAAFLTGQLAGNDPELGLTMEQTDALRMRVFGAELAAVNLAAAAREATGTGVRLQLRGHLAGELDQVRRRVGHYPALPLWADRTMNREVPPAPSPLELTEAPANWPAPARRLQLAINEMSAAAEALQNTRAGDLGPATGGNAGPGSASAESAPTGAGVRDSTGENSGSHQTTATPERRNRLRRAVQAALSTGLALWVGSLVSVSYQYWAALPAFQVLGGTDGETFVKAMQRIVGTVAGAAVGFGLAIAVGSHPAVLLPVLGLCVFASTYFRPVSAPLATFWQTMMFAQLYELLGKLDTETIELRILETVIGAVIALAVAALIWPTHTRSKLAADTSRFVRTAKGVVTMCLLRLKGNEAGAYDAAEFSRQELVMTEQLRKVQTTAAPLRRSWGALDVRGVEGQLTALWALLFYTNHFIAAGEKLSARENTLSPEQWSELQRMTEDNFDALLAALEGRLAGVVHGDLRLAHDAVFPQSRDLHRVLHALERIMQTTAVLLQDVQPSRTDSGSTR
ncbi:FUSC family protein [Arthrobacter sp. Helios]|uniref:FUSC family protein n=1 Tax=Arthrobacter sp. Helios TaxID=2828862 RepID=UPI00206DDAF2|nr:FUSC family protein [Arthrobacter sp. Helios]UPO77896.1 FUSC family protein [Arthrobacter sp. Helios]